MNSQLSKLYFDMHFSNEQSITHFPSNFAIISAYPILGKKGAEDHYLEADEQLKAHLNKTYFWVKRLVAFSPETNHIQPSWAVATSWKEACEIGLTFKQDVIYYVAGNTLSVSFCDQRRKLIAVGDFLKQLRSKSDYDSV